MAKSKVKLDFIDLSVPAKIQFTRDRVGDMSGGGVFPTPDVSYATLDAGADDLEIKYQAAQGGGEAETVAQDASEAVLDDLLRKTAGFVDRIADGDIVIITSAGFDFTDVERSSVPAPAKPENQKLTHGDDNATVKTITDPVANARGYVTVAKSDPAIDVTIIGNELIIQTGNGNHVVIHAGTTRSNLLTNLVRGTKYRIYKYAFNASGKGPNSDTDDIIAP